MQSLFVTGPSKKLYMYSRATQLDPLHPHVRFTFTLSLALSSSSPCRKLRTLYPPPVR